MSDSARPADPRKDFDAVEARLRDVLARRTTSPLGDLDTRPVPNDAPLVAAAVAVLLERAPGYNVILTKRTQTVEHHKGQISFPGGAQDDIDVDNTATALRETHEEIGIDPSQVTVLGALSDLVTVTNFQVAPIVCVVDANLKYTLHEAEVDRLLKVPMHVLRAPESWFDDEREWRGRTYRLRSCRYGDDVIWGATSRILQNFLEVVPRDIL